MLPKVKSGEQPGSGSAPQSFSFGAFTFGDNSPANYNVHQEYPIPKEARAREQCILNTPELFYEPKPWGLTLPQYNRHFVGRTETLDSLKATFLDGAHQATAVVINQERASWQTETSTQAQGVVGLGGVGKTQLAAQYIHQLMKVEEEKIAGTSAMERQYALIVWLPGERNRLEMELRALAEWLGLVFEKHTPIRPITQALYERLAKLSQPLLGQPTRPRVLFILDDGQWEEGFQELLPQPYDNYRNCFHWLLTSREQTAWTRYFGEAFKRCEVGPFSEREAQRYFDEILATEVKQQVDYTTENCMKLAHRLGCLPLALAQASAYINAANNRVSITKYLKRFEKYRVELLKDEKLPAGEKHEPVAVTWRITLAAMQEKCPKAIKLLEALSFLDSIHIPYFLIKAWTKQAEQPWNKLELEEALRTITDYSMMQQSKRGDEITYTMHNLVQLVIRSGLD